MWVNITARANQDQTLELLDSPNRSVWVERDVTDTQVENYVKEVSDRLVVPTLFLSGSIFALSPLQKNLTLNRKQPMW